MRIQDQKWHKETVRALRQYPILQKRIEIINLQMIRQAGPSTKVTWPFASSTNEYYDLEAELEEKKGRVNEIDLALQVLDDDENQVIRWKYFNNRKDYQIYQELKPMGPNTYYQILNNAVEKLAKCLGYLQMQ